MNSQRHKLLLYDQFQRPFCLFAIVAFVCLFGRFCCYRFVFVWGKVYISLDLTTFSPLYSFIDFFIVCNVFVCVCVLMCVCVCVCV